jgi:streptogramin lyase
MSMQRLVLRVFCVSLLTCRALSAQTSTTPTTLPLGTLYAVENSKSVSGVRIKAQPDGTVWFLVPSNDRIIQLQADGVTMKQWQIRADNSIGANPVDFTIDGDIIWFIENGESLIDAGKSVFARLDTTTGQLREWILPGSVPAGYYLAPDNKVWIPQTNGRLQSMDLDTLDVVDYRSSKTFAYGNMVVAPDGTFWLTDFGNNRIVHYTPGAASETSWTFFDPNTARLNPSQIQFDDQGFLWMSLLSGGTMEKFDPATGDITEYAGFLDPIHFDIFAGRLYISEAPADKGRVVVLDPLLAGSTTVPQTSETLTVASVPNKLKGAILDSTIVPTTFVTKPQDLLAADLTMTNDGPGILRTQYGLTNAYGIDVEGGVVWVGADGGLQRLVLQTIGGSSDLTTPVAISRGVTGPFVKTDITLYNRGSAPLSVDILYLYSPAAFAAKTSVTVAPGETQLISNALSASNTDFVGLFGPIRLMVTSGAPDDLSASVRSYKPLDDGSSFGYAIQALSSNDSLNAGAGRFLFTGTHDSDISVLGFYSPSGATFTAALVAPDGSLRGTRAFSLASNIAQEFNPASLAFGVTTEPGDVVFVSVDSGVLQPYVAVLDTGTFDEAMSLPVAATRDAVFPNLGTLVGFGDTSFVSDLLLSNSDRANPANVSIRYFPAGTSDSPLVSTLTLAPGASQVIADVLGTLFSVTAGQGALIVSADVPVAVSSRVAARHDEGDYATFSAALDGGATIVGGTTGTGFGVPQTAVRRTHLLLFNNGEAGTVTVVGYDGKGNAVGTLSVDMAESQALRLNSVMEQLGAPGQSVGRIGVTSAPGMQLYAETAEVDLDTGDVEFARVK